MTAIGHWRHYQHDFRCQFCMLVPCSMRQHGTDVSRLCGASLPHHVFV